MTRSRGSSKKGRGGRTPQTRSKSQPKSQPKRSAPKRSTPKRSATKNSGTERGNKLSSEKEKSEVKRATVRAASRQGYASQGNYTTPPEMVQRVNYLDNPIERMPEKAMVPSTPREFVKLSPCEDDAELSGLFSTIDVMTAMGNQPDLAKITLKVNGVPDSEIERIARESGATGLFKRVKKEYEKCPTNHLTPSAVKQIMASIAEQDIEVIKSAKEFRLARELASDEARGLFDFLVSEDYAGKPRREALKTTINSIKARQDKVERIKNRTLKDAEEELAKLSLLDEKSRLQRGDLAMAGSYDDFTRLSKVTDIAEKLEQMRLDTEEELKREQEKAFTETVFLETDVSKLTKMLETIYSGTDKMPKFSIKQKDEKGVPMYTLVKDEDMSATTKQMKLMHDTFQNHLQQANKCRVLLSRHGIDSEEKWKKLMDMMEKGAPTDQANLKFASCLETAMWAYMMKMYDQTSELLDTDMIVKADSFKGGYSDDFNKKFDKSNPNLPKFEEFFDGTGNTANNLLKAYIDFVTKDQATRTLEPDMKNFALWSKFGTGFNLDGGVFMPAPMKQMLEDMIDGDKKKDLFEKGLKGVYDRVQARTGHENAYDLLSVQAKQVLHIRNSIKQRVLMKLGEGDSTACPINRFIRKYIEGDDKRVGTYPFLEEPSIWAGIELGVPSTETSRKIFKALSDAFEGVVKENEDLKKIDASANDVNKVIPRLFEVFDMIFATDVDCDHILTLAKSERQPFFERHFTGDTVYSSAAAMMEAMGCEISALTFDRALQGPLRSVREEIHPFAPLSLVDELLLRLDLPSMSTSKSKFSGDLDTIVALQLDIDEEFDNAVEQMKKRLDGIFGMLNDADYLSVMAKVISASIALRDFKYSFLLAPEPTTDEIWALLGKGRYLYKLKEGKVSIGTIDAVVTDLAGYRNRLKDPEEVKKVVTEVKQHIKTFDTSENLLQMLDQNDSLSPLTAYATFMDAYKYLKDKGRLLVVLPDSITYAYMDTIGKLDKSSFTLKGTLPYQNLVWESMKKYAEAMMTFSNIFDGSITDPDVWRKQIRMLQKQAETLCNLPESECKSSKRCVFAKASAGKGVCLVRGRQELDEKKEVKWTREATLQLSKTKMVASGAETGRKYDLYQIGWEDVKQNLLDPSGGAKKLFSGLKAVDLINKYIDTLYTGVTPSRVKPDNKIVMGIFEGLVYSTKAQLEFMEKLRMDPDVLCRTVHMAIKEINEFVVDLEARPNETKNTIQEKLTKFTEIFLSKEGEEDEESDKRLNIPPPMVINLLCRLVHAIYMQHNQIRSLNCNLNASDCKANSKSGGMCVWRSNTCMNPAIHQLKAFSEGAGALGIVHRMLLPEYAKMLVGNSRPDSYGVDDIPALERVLVAVFGEDVASLRYMNPLDQMKRLETLTQYSDMDSKKKGEVMQVGDGEELDEEEEA